MRWEKLGKWQLLREKALLDFWFDYFAIKYCLSRNISKLNKLSSQLKRDQARIIKRGII